MRDPATPTALVLDRAKRCDTNESVPKDPKDAQIGLRLPQSMRKAWQDAADKDGRTLTSWIMARCNGLEASGPIAPDGDSARGKRKVR